MATQATNEIWDNVSVNLPANHRPDPGLLRLNKSTGAAIGFHLISGAPGYDDALTAVTADNDGNYVAGGYFYYSLFTAENDNVPMLNKVIGGSGGTDFFITKLAASPCGTPASTVAVHHNDVKVYPNPVADSITIQSEAVLSGYEVLNMLGQVLLQGNFYDSGNTIAMRGLSAGTYIIVIKTVDNAIITHKVIKE